MKYIELFAGIGGFRLGIENAYLRRLQQNNTKRPEELHNIKNKLGKWECVYTNEWNKYAAQIYEKNYEKPDTRDITKVKAKEIPDHDLLTAGFPCQAFSIAGKRGGFNDTRGTLFFDIARIAKEKRPKYLLLENVKGLLSHDNGRTFKTIISTLTELGYDTEWQVLNSKNFGVPQNRERVFIIGHLGGIGRPKVFPIGEATKGFIKVCARGKHQQDIVYDKEGILNLPAGTHGSTPHLTKIADYRGDEGLRIRKNNITPTLKARSESEDHYNSILAIKDSKIRRLTPTECERLQGFPDGWTEGISDTQRYKCLGNAVTTNVITAIIKRI